MTQEQEDQLISEKLVSMMEGVIEAAKDNPGYVYAPYRIVTRGILVEDKSGKYYTDYGTKKTAVTRGPSQKSLWVAMRLMKKPHSSLYERCNKPVNPAYYGTIKVNQL